MKYSLRHAQAQAGQPGPCQIDRGNRILHGGRVERVMSGHLAEQRRQVGRRAGQGAHRVQRGPVGDQPVARDAAVGGLQAGDAAERGRLAHRAAGVGAQGRKTHAGRHRGRRPSRGAPGHPLQVPRVVGDAVGRVFGGRAHGELIGVGLAQRHRAGVQQALYAGGGVGWAKALQDARAAGGRRPLQAQHILDRQRDPGQQGGRLRAGPPPGRQAAVGRPGLFERQIVGHVQERVHLSVERLDAAQAGPSQLLRGQFAGAQGAGGFH